MSSAPNLRILVIDDNASIHADYRKILGAGPAAGSVPSDARAAFFGEPAAEVPSAAGAFELESAYQGEEGLECVRAALAAERPYALAFVDVRMPPGIDGVQTARRLWEIDPELQVVICTAFADYTWEALSRELGRSDRLLILKKPFDPIEVVQLATALTEKWNSACRERASTIELRRAVQEARAYAASITTVNRALVAAHSSAEAHASAAARFEERLAAVLQESCTAMQVLVERADLEGAGSRCLELRNTVRNLALHARLELQTLVAHDLPFSPGALQDDLVARWRERAELLGLRLGCDCPGVLPQSARGDPELVTWILDALVENALRVSQGGSVQLSVNMPVCDEGAEPLLEYSVADSGPGIPAARQPQAFEAFAHEPDPAQDIRGAHFSLHMARRLARFLGGDLELESSPGKGCCFRLRIPAGDLAGVEFGVHPPGPLPSSEPARRSEEARP